VWLLGESQPLQLSSQVTDAALNLGQSLHSSQEGETIVIVSQNLQCICSGSIPLQDSLPGVDRIVRNCKKATIYVDVVANNCAVAAATPLHLAWWPLAAEVARSILDTSN
jgi:hypothetical protein